MSNINDELINSAKKYSDQYGIPTEIILGFAGLETGFGTAGKGTPEKGYNAFGIGNNTYSSYDEATADFVKLVTGNKSSSQSKKYGQATSKAKTIDDWINAIRDNGYNSEFEDGVYESKVLKIISDNNLSRYNTGSPSNYIQGNIGDSSNISGNDNSISGDIYPNMKANNLGLEWWGDIVKVIICILLIIVGVVFLGVSVTNNNILNTIKNPVKNIKKVVSK